MRWGRGGRIRCRRGRGQRDPAPSMAWGGGRGPAGWRARSNQEAAAGGGMVRQRDPPSMVVDLGSGSHIGKRGTRQREGGIRERGCGRTAWASEEILVPLGPTIILLIKIKKRGESNVGHV
ncbi:hypothetical protein BRADI_1g09513v3 [Brachypodium distachyon]|uniref:Uncharacterized protein n=1 Tax=Brachypodium distachyon TaxID=15368 RepID=A0A2K2DIT0_BRADI|nr:hypothetical protein BRADI_1g09513v3 [Brachypodium distachyon]